MGKVNYLAGIAAATPLYVALYVDAVGLLPPPTEGGRLMERLESRRPIRDLATRFHRSVAVMTTELKRLQNYGWIEAGTPRLLGHRQGLSLFLLADIEAERHTGQQLVVSQMLRELLAASSACGSLATATTPDTPLAAPPPNPVPPAPRGASFFPGRGLSRTRRPGQ